jgi:hypothetical protein
MASHSLPIPFPQAQERTRAPATSRTPSLWTAVVIFVALLILFGWLHLIVALQIASTNREIQIMTQDLDVMERQRAILLRQIAEAESPILLEKRLLLGGYQPKEPVYYLLLPESAAGDAMDGDSERGYLPPVVTDAQTAASRSPSLLETVIDDWRAERMP